MGGAGRYNRGGIERTWQERWRADRCFEAEPHVGRPREYHYAAGPFTNGRLHLGHVRTFVLADVMARAARQRGRDVLYSFEFDAFGLPTELAAQALGVSPATLIDDAAARMRSDLERLGLSVDWSRVHVTADPRWYRWTQWLFLRLYERDLIYRGRAILNYCTSCETSLAYLQVTDGNCWRCGAPVEKREMTQWFVRLSTASSRLLETLPALEGWSSTVRRLLSGFIGEVEGFDVDLAFPLSEGKESTLTAFVPRSAWPHRPTAVVVAAGHPDVARVLRDSGIDSAARLVDTAALRRRRREALADAEGVVDTGLRARHPACEELLPVLASPELDPGFGTGVTVTGEGVDDEADPVGPGIRRAVHHRVQDWLVSRQRSWGTPIPILVCDDCGDVPVPEADLPLALQVSDDGTRTIGTTTCPRCGGAAAADPDTLDCFFDVIWSHIGSAGRLGETGADPFEEARPWQPMTWFHNGLDSFIYAHLHRFLGYLLHDMALVDEPEPIANYHGHALVQLAGRKMSKSEGNVVDALTLLDEVGADVLRLQVLWAGNPMQTIEWRDEPPRRVRSFLSSVQRLVLDNLDAVRAHAGEEATGDAQTAVRRASEKVSLFIDQYRPGAALDELHRLSKHVGAVRDSAPDAAVFANGVVALVQLLGPFAPHLAEELWGALSLGSEPLAVGGWPV